MSFRIPFAFGRICGRTYHLFGIDLHGHRHTVEVGRAVDERDATRVAGAWADRVIHVRARWEVIDA